MNATPSRSLSLAILALLALAVALSLAQTLIAPLTLAFVTAIILGPVNNRIRMVGLNPTPAALITLVAALAVLVVLALLFRPWVAEVVEAWPRMRSEIRRTMIEIRVHLGALFDIQREVLEAIDPGADAGSNGNADSMPTLSDAAWLAPLALAQIILFVGGLFFILVGKDDLYSALTDRFSLCHKGAFAAAETRVARYFGTVAIINLGFGAAVAIALSIIGLPAAPLWGVIAALANFVLYLGPAVIAAALVVAGTVSFDGAASFLPAAVFVGLNATEGQFVTPSLLGRQMRLSPLLVFVSLAFWLWLWGPVGGIVAIPLLLWGMEIFRGAAAQAEAASGALSMSDNEASRSSGSNDAGLKAR